MSKNNYEKYAEVKQQELLHKERNLQQAISCLRDRRKFASLQCMDSAIDFVADLYDLSIDEVKRAMDEEEYWCIWNLAFTRERMIKNMAYVKNKNGFEIGDWATTTKKVDSCAGYFEKGTKVKVIGKSYRGYDLEDENERS